MSDSIGSTLQVVVVGLISVLVVIVIAVFAGFNFLTTARFLSTVAENGAVQVEGIVTSAISQANAIIQGAENTVVGIAGDVTNAVITGLQLIFGTVTSIGTGVLDAISDGAGAITDILIELQQNLTTAFINFFTPVKDIYVMYGNVFNDVLSAVQSAFGPVEAIINGTILLACCVAQAIRNFPDIPSFSLPGGCATNDCGCLCSSCDSACTNCPCSSGTTCTCAGRGSTPCCQSFFS
jgi:hypothetical protein